MIGDASGNACHLQQKEQRKRTATRTVHDWIAVNYVIVTDGGAGADTVRGLGGTALAQRAEAVDAVLL